MPGDELEDLRLTKDPRHPVAALLYGRSPVVICDDGTAWMWAVPTRVLEQLTEHQRFQADTDAGYLSRLHHEWVQFHTPIPGTEAYAEWAR
jgi:hypothetical protein